MKRLAVPVLLAALAVHAQSPDVPWGTLPEVVEFVGPARAESESWLPLGPFTLLLVCPTGRPCGLFLLDARGAVEPRSVALEPAAAMTAGERRSGAWLRAVEGGGVAVMVSRTQSAASAVALVALDARGAPVVTVPATAVQEAPLVLGDDPPGLRSFRKGRRYADLLGPGSPAPQVVALPGGRWVLGLVTAPASVHLACGERRVFVVDAQAGAVNRKETSRLEKALQRALASRSSSVACASSLELQGEAARLSTHTGGKHGFFGVVDVGLGPKGGLPLVVRLVE